MLASNRSFAFTSFVLLLALPLDAQRTRRTPRPESERSGVVTAGLPRPVGTEAIAHPIPKPPNVDVTQSSAAQNETAIALDPSNPLNLVAGTNDYRTGDAQAGVSYSFDGGVTWTASTLELLDSTSGKYGVQGDPAIAPYRNGVFYYAYIDFNRGDSNNRLAVARSTDGGVTWPQVGVIDDNSLGGSQDFEDKEYIACDNTGGTYDGNVYVTWTRFPAVGATVIYGVVSTDGGATFSAPVQIGDLTGGVQGSVPVVAPNGDVYVAWLDNGMLSFDVSTDGGATYGVDRTVAVINQQFFPLPGASYRGNSFPTIAVDTSGGPNNGTIYVAWGDRLGLGGSPDILLSRSTDGGVTWSAPVSVSDDTNGSYQFFPWLGVGPDGVVSVVFFDRRRAPNSEFYDTFVAQSFDGGLTFDRNRRVSSQMSDSLNDGFGGFFIGDYNGIASWINRVHPFWTDCRSANRSSSGLTTVVPRLR